MKRIIPFLTLLILMTANSCNPFKDVSLDSITELYDGRISIAKGVRASTSQGNGSYLKLIVEENTFIASGWLSPEAMANNCALLLVKANPQTFDKADLLEIEIVNTASDLFEYRKQDLYDIGQGYSKIESILDEFVSTIEANKIDEAIRFMKPDSNANESRLSSFFKSVRNVLPTSHKGTKLIGYREVNASEKTYEVDFVVISQDDVKRMIKATLVEDKSELRFRDITI